ncbi:OTU domain-containing protein 4 [Pelodytes ibericus]
MDLYLKTQGLYRKKIAKDGSCLFRAVAEQVLHSQTQHLEIRKSCINYLRENRGQFEAFIEGPFEEYLKRLENPQEWVGQVEISALSLMFKKDFVIYQEPNVPPAYVTRNDFSEKILLCFSNGNHYDIIYPISFVENAALCQSIVYEILYEKVLDVDVAKMDLLDIKADEEVCRSDTSGSDMENEIAGNEKRSIEGMNGFKSQKVSKHPKNNGEPAMPRSVLRSLNSSVYRNVEYDVWLKSQRDQQKLDFSIAAGMQYSVGDKCQVRLEPGGIFYNAHIQEVSVENGPVVVFIADLGKKHAVQLKNLKPVPLTISNPDGWNTVAGKKVKKTPASDSITQLVKDKGQKVSKAAKPQVASSPRLQQSAGNKLHGLSTQSLPDPATQCDNKGRSRTPPKVPGRKLERSEQSNYFKRESVHFGLTTEERREKQAIEESKALYEMQSRDQEAFPALSTSPVDQAAVQSNEVFSAKKVPNLNIEKHMRRKSEAEDLQEKAPRLAQTAKVADQKVAEEVTEAIATSDAAHILPSSPEQPTSTTVPSAAPTETALSGIPAQIPAAVPDSTTLQSQATSAQFTQLPIPAVSQPMLPIPQTLSAYQDPLYPGYPLNEKDESASVPPYSFCKTGEDLPTDKSILRFFFNLGIKAYTYPMWPPQSYLYPLRQASMCRMYPNIHLYPQGHWVQEAPLNQSPVDSLPVVHHGEVRPEREGPHSVTLPSIPEASSAGAADIAEQISNQSGSEMKNQVEPQGVEFDPVVNKPIIPHSMYGQGAYMSHVPMAPSYFPHFWYGYPYQAYIDNPVVRHNVFITPENISCGQTIENDVSIQPAVQSDSTDPTRLDLPLLPAGATHSNAGLNTCPLKAEQQITHVTHAAVGHQEFKEKKEDNKATYSFMATNIPHAPAAEQNLPVKMINHKSTFPSLTRTVSPEVGSATAAVHKGSADKAMDTNAVWGMQTNLPDERSLRAREESSEDEKEVFNMLTSGRSKNFYSSQSYSTRRPRYDKSYQPGRGGYQYARNEEGWRGQRGREDGYQHHRNFRGRPYRRRSMGDNHRVQHE